MIVRVRKDQDFTLGASKPCATCLPILKRLGVWRVHYVTREGDLVVENVREMHTDHVCAGAKYGYK